MSFWFCNLVNFIIFICVALYSRHFKCIFDKSFMRIVCVYNAWNNKDYYDVIISLVWTCLFSVIC